MKRIFNIFPVLFFIFIYLNVANATTANQFTLTDVLAFKRIGQVLASPDGKQVAYTSFQMQTNTPNKQWNYWLYLRDQNRKTSVLLKNNGITALNWSPDGKQIAFLSKGNKFQSIWITDLNTHKTNKLFEFQKDILSFKISPNGKDIAFVADDLKTKSSIPKLIDTATDFTHSRIYLIVLGLNPLLAKPITPNNYSITPYFDSGFDWSPDSQSIAFSFQPQPSANFENKNKIALLNLKNLKIKPLPYSDNHMSNQPSYSPDGKWLAFRSNEIPTTTPTELNNYTDLYNKICILDLHSQNTRCLENTFNESPINIGWNATSNAVIYVELYKSSGLRVYSLDINSTSTPKLISVVEGFIENQTITLNQNHSILGFGYETVSGAPEAYISPINPFKLEQVSHLQSQQNKTLGNVEVIRWKSNDDLEIEGLLLTPPHFDDKKSYPLLVTIHGGPAGAYAKRYLGTCDEFGEGFIPTCWANLLSKGFVILQPNPRGSSGYGKSFRLGIQNGFGSADFDDIMSGVNYLTHKGIADENHLAIFGWSYGGYMTAWAITQTHRFKSAIVGAGITDLISNAMTSDAARYLPRYFGDDFWNNDKLYLERSPILFTKKIATPVLILHGQNDQRVPVGQAIELFNALNEQKKAVKLLIAPDTGHVFTEPNLIYESINAVDEWLKYAL